MDTESIARDVASTDFKKFKDGSVEICVCMDCTGSMGSWIEAAKTTSLETVHALRDKMPGAKFRLAFVGYRDFGDKAEQFVVVPFTEDVASVESTLRSVCARGGADTCEDMAGGLAAASELAWSSDYVQGRDTRVLICVADAPPHGAEMHDVTVDDHHPRTDPAGRNAESLRGIVRDIARRGCDFYFMKVNSSTDVCIREFARVFDAARAMPEQSFVVLNLTSSNGASGTSARARDRVTAPAVGGGEPAAAAYRAMSFGFAGGVSRSKKAAAHAPAADVGMAEHETTLPAARMMAMRSAAPAMSSGYSDAVTNSVLRSVMNQRKG